MLPESWIKNTIRQDSLLQVSGASLLKNCILCLKDKLNAKKCWSTHCTATLSKQCKANPITEDRTRLWNMHFCHKGYLFEYKKHQFNLLTCKCCQPENILPPCWDTKKALFFTVLNIICSITSVLLSFFQFYGNNYNNLIWFVRQNKWECGAQKWSRCFES